MRKFFIGCGVVVLLILAAGGYFVYRMWGPAQELVRQIDAARQELEALDASHPFDPLGQQHLESQRFTAMLGVRVGMIKAMQGTRDDMNRVWGEGEQKEDIGFFEAMRLTLGSIGDVVPRFAEALRAADMGPTEFAWLTRVMWSALHRVDAGAAGEELADLKDQYGNFKDNYDHMARDNKWKPLEEVLGELPPAVIIEATAAMAGQVPLVKQSLAVTELDYYYMGPFHKLDEVQALRVSHGAERAAPTATTTPVPPVEAPEPAADGGR